MKTLKRVFLIIMLLSLTIQSFAQFNKSDDIFLVTFGKECSTLWGDDDKNQIFFISVPEDTKRFYLWIFDPDCGGKVDEINRKWNTSTQFEFFGGKGAFTHPDAKSVNPKEGLTSGESLKKEVFRRSRKLDNKWVKWGPFKASQGEKVGENRIFKLVVKGLNGDDGNLYKFFVSSSKTKKRRILNEKSFTYEVCFRYPDVAKTRLSINFVPEKPFTALTFYNFDGDNAGGVRLNTPSRNNLELNISNDDEWASKTYTANSDEKIGIWSVNLDKPIAGNNDAVVYTVDQDNNPVPLSLPLSYTIVENPIAFNETASSDKLKGCNCYSFDGSKTIDQNIGDKLTYQWDFGDGQTAEGVIVDHCYQQSGKYSITLTVRDNSGTICAVAHSTVDIKINEPPVADAGAETKSCPETEIKFDGSRSFDLDGKIAEYNWDFGDGQTATGEKVTHKYSNPGNYVVKLTVKDDSDSKCNTGYDETKVYINAPPVADAGPDQKLGIKTVEFNGLNSYDPDAKTDNKSEALVYIWDFGDKSPLAYGPRPIHNYDKPGTYTVKLTVKDKSDTKCNTAVDTMTVILNSPPIAKAGEDKLTCANEEITFNGSKSSDIDGEIVKYTWDMGDGTILDGQEVKHKYETPGTYSVRLTVEDNANTINSKDVDGLTVVVNNPPVAVAGKDFKTCSAVKNDFDGTKSYDSDGEIVEYLWDFGDGKKDKGEKPSHTYDKPGTYKVKLTVKDNSKLECGIAVDELTVFVNNPPIAAAGEDIRTCKPAVDFDASKSTDSDGKVLQYHWDFGDGHKGSGIKPTHLYAKEGTYKVKLTVFDDSGTQCNSGNDELVVFINSSPIAEAGPEKMITCPGEELSFDAGKSKDLDGKILAYEWDFGDGSKVETTAKTKHKFEKPGNYLVKLKVQDDSKLSCDTAYDSILVKVNAQPVADAGTDWTICEGDDIQFSGASSYDIDGKLTKYEWDFGDGGKSEESAPKHAFTKPGEYTVKLKVTDDSETKCNSHEDTVKVTVLQKLLANAGVDIQSCNLTVQFDGSKSVGPKGYPLIYEWDFGDGTPTQGGVNPIHTYTKPGIYDVSLTLRSEIFGCEASKSNIKVTIYQPPVAVAGEKQEICIGDEVNFDGSKSYSVSSKISEYIWDFGDGLTAKGDKVSHKFTKAGVYQVLLTVKDEVKSNCNIGTSTVTIIVNAPPVADAGADTKVCVNDEVQFDGSKSVDPDGKIVKYEWDFGDGNKGTGIKPTHTYAEGGIYDVTLTVTDNSNVECNSHTDKIKIVVKRPPVAEAGPEQMIVCIGCAQDEVTFDASKSYDPDGDGLTFTWDFGDGNTAKGMKVVHTYTKPGDYTVTLTVKDNSGLKCDTAIDTIKVKANIAPEPVIEIKQAKVENK